jgi:signal transduction histidine kinase
MPVQSRSEQYLDPASSAVLARVAHELRQPLSAVTAAVMLMKADVHGEHRARACRVMERQCARLARLIEDLVVIATLRSDVTMLTKETIDLNRAVSDLAESFQPLAGAKEQLLDVVLPPRPCWIEADPLRLDQVFSNLLTNAIKYTNAGGHVWAMVQRCDDRAVVTIGDTGRGISPEDLPRVFDLFTTLNEDGEGLGIGLTVARHLVVLHGGSIAVASGGRGHGTEVTVTLRVISSASANGMSEAGSRQTAQDCSRR